ncbi:MAG: gliding motility-associated C-terminal domain-containing protein [Candidatus Zixiibacteriota bacterium]
MRRLLTAFTLMVLILVPLTFAKDDPFLVKELDMNVRGIPEPFEMLDAMEYTTELGCRLDTGAVDIVWSLDTSGSMGGEISGVRSAIGSFISELDARGYDYRFGAACFGDRPPRLWDFDPGTPGFQMTSNSSEFVTRLNATGVSGGGDWPEVQLDAIAHSITDYDWRPDAMRVIITFTDAPYHERGDGSGFSDYLDSEVYSMVMSTGTVVFFAHDCSDAGASAWYTSVAEDSGGESYSLSTPWSAILDDVVDLLNTWEAINAHIVNNTGVTCAVNAMLMPIDPSCIGIESTNPVTGSSVSPGGDWHLGWHVDIDSSCTGASRCFNIRLWGCGGEEDTIFGCTTDDSCRCVGPEAEVTSPLLTGGDCGVISACEYQTVQWRIWTSGPDAEPVDPSTIEITVDGVTYNYPDHMTYVGEYLTFTPTVPWTHGQRVDFSLDNVLSMDGCPMFGGPSCHFFVDLEPPELLADITPECGIHLDDTMYSGLWEIADDLAGIDALDAYFTVNGDPFYMGSPYVDFTGTEDAGTFSLTGTFRELGFLGEDSVNVCLNVGDLVESEYCGPNDTTYCCVYYLNNPPYAYFVYPGLDSITACNPDSIVLHFWDPDDAIDPNSLLLEVDGIPYTVMSDELSYHDDSVFVFMPPFPDYFTSGDTIECVITAGSDPWGEPIEDLPIEWSFVVDYDPPMIEYYEPIGDWLYMPDSAHISFIDLVSGLDTTAFVITVNGEVVEDFTEGWGEGTALDSVYNLEIPLSMEYCIGYAETCIVEICVEDIQDMPDYCAPNDTTICWDFRVIRSGPVPEIVYPAPETYVACHDSTITLHMIEALAPVDSSSIRLTINDITYDISSDSLFFIPSDSLSSGSYIVFNPGYDYWLDDTVYHVSLDSCSDIYGTPMPDGYTPFTWSFYTDFSPPVFWSPFPYPGATVATESPTISVNLTDSITNVDPASVSITIRDTLTFGASHSCVTYDDSTGYLEILTGCAGIEFADQETVQVCIDAYDTPNYCDPNDTTYCWEFIVSLRPPDPGIVTYVPSSHVACDSAEQAVLMTIMDVDGVDETSIVLSVEDTIFYWGDPELTWTDDSILTFTPLSPETYFRNAQIIDICLLRVADLLGNVSEDTLCWSFEMDLSPPRIWNPMQRPDTVINDSLAPISIWMWDSLTGIDTSTVYMVIDGDTMTLEDSCLVWEDGDSVFNELSFDISCIGSSWTDWDTVNVWVGACDSPDTCAPNCATFEWRFFVHLTGPTASIITPTDGQISACDDQCIEIMLSDDWEGVDDTTITLVINESDTFGVDSPMLTYTEADSLLEFCPDSAAWRYWANEEEIHVELIEASDSLGNPLGTPLDWRFEVDLEAPVASMIEPLPYDTLTTLLPTVEFDLSDNLAGLDESTIRLVMNGTVYTVDSSGVSWDGTHFNVTSGVMFSGGDSVRACIYADDNPDLCSANGMDTCWIFYLESGGPTPRIVRPFDGAISACSDEYIEFTVSDDNGIIDTSLHFFVVRSTDMSDTAFVDYDDPEVTYSYVPLPDHEATVRYEPDLAFFDPETVYVCITDAIDSLYNPMETPLCWEFYMDTIAPVMWDPYPPAMDVIDERMPEISFKLYDEISGLDLDSTLFSAVVRIEGGGSWTFNLSDSCLTWTEAESLFTISTECAGIEFGCGDRVEVRIVANDSPDYCSPNTAFPDWSFNLETGGPEAEIIRPWPDSTSSCEDEYVGILLDDANGIDPTTIVLVVDGDTIRIDDPDLTYDPDTDMLYYVPDPIFPDDATIHVELLEAVDSLGCGLETPLDWEFHMDRIPPSISGVSPTDSTADPSPMIQAYVFDYESGVNEDSIRVIVDGVEYDLTDPALEMLGDSTLRFDPDVHGIRWSGGDTVCITISTFDNADDYYGIGDFDGDDCPPNWNDTTWCFRVRPGGPVANYIYPFDGAWVACDPDSVAMTLEDEDGVVDSSVVVWIGRPDVGIDTTLTTDSPQIDYDGSLNLIWYPDPGYEDGEHINISIIEAYDVLFNDLETHDTLSFRIDLTPPVHLSHVPATDSVLDDIRPEICIEIFDSLSGIDPATIILTIDDTDYAESNPAVDWDGTSMLCFDAATADVRWYGGDSVHVGVCADDSPDFCAPHSFCYDYFFHIAPGGPVPNWVRPEPGAWSACPDEEIQATIEDPQGILDSTIVVEVERYAGTATSRVDTFTIADSGEFFWSYPDLTIHPAEAFASGESIYVCIVAVEDSISNPLADPLCWGFNMDLDPPEYWNPVPFDGEELLVRNTPISINIYDYLTGVDTESIELTYDNNRTGSESFGFDDTGITYSETDSLITLEPTAAGIEWRGGDSICVYIEAFDSPTSPADSGYELDYCEPNDSEYRWCFTVAPGGPIAEIQRPYDSTFSSCIDEHLVIYLTDDDVGVDITTLSMMINSEHITWPDTRLEYENDTLYFYPDPIFADGSTYRVQLNYIADMLGNESYDLLDWSFTIDRTPPAFFVEQPPLPEPFVPSDYWMTRNQEQPIVIRIEEDGSGLLERSIVFSIMDSIEYTPAELDYEYNADGGYAMIRFDPADHDIQFTSGDTVIFRIEASDTVEYCDHNIDTARYHFLIEPKVVCLEHPNPFTPNDDGYNEIAVFDYPGMISEEAELKIFDKRKQLVYEREMGPVSQLSQFESRSWDGRDNNGKLMPPGIYIYVILKDGELVCQGTVVLVR